MPRTDVYAKTPSVNDNKISIAVVPVAGMGTRLLPATKSQPKEMLPLAKKPVVQYVVEEVEKSGINEILFVTGKNKTSIENHFDSDHELVRNLRESGKETLLSNLDHKHMGLQFFYTRQRHQKGLGDAVRCARYFTRENPFVVALGDSIIGLESPSRVIRTMTQAYWDSGASCVVAVERVSSQDISRYGIVTPGGEGPTFPILSLIEKPPVGTIPSSLAIAGRYVFSPAIYRALAKTPPGVGGEIQLTDAIQILLEEGEMVVGVLLPEDEKRYDIGNFESYFQTFVDFALSDPDLGPGLHRRLKERLLEDH